MMKNVLRIILISQLMITQQSFGQTAAETGNLWKVGVAKTIITPRENMWMSGYAARKEPARGVLHDLWAKAMALEDNRGNRALVITVDIIGFSREMSVDVCHQLMEKFNLKRENIVLSSSHTHSGPVINSNLYGIYPQFDEHQQRQVADNLAFVKRQMIDVAARAMSNLTPATLSSGTGIARFAVNRRENELPEDSIYYTQVKGPSDHVVQVIKVSDPTGKPTAVLFGYSCHATCLSGHLWSGDYPGFAQIELERNNPGLTALFFTGFAGDQNPMPRGKVTQAEQYGKELAIAVEKVLKEPAEPLNAKLYTSYEEIELAIDPPPADVELDEVIEDGDGWHKRWALAMKEKKSKGIPMENDYPHYPIQSWQLGAQSLVILGGEVVVDYAFRLRKILGNELMIMGYANDVMAYIPSERVLKEGGYEGEISMYVYGHDGKWSSGIEDKIVDVAIRQVKYLRKEAGYDGQQLH